MVRAGGFFSALLFTFEKKLPDMTAVLDKKITIEEYLAREDFEEGFYYELIEGEIVKKSAPAPRHQNASNNLAFALNQFIRANNLGKIYTAPIDVFFDDFNALEPDIIFIAKERLSIVTENGIEGIPDLVVEILSPGTAHDDRGRKLKVYRRTGVREYWIVDPRSQTIEVYVLLEGEFELTSFATEAGEVQSQVLAGFKTTVAEVFA
jgi:Uma2 family endonuclease